MKKEYTKPMVIVTVFNTEDITNALATSSITSFTSIDKEKFSVVEF